MRAGHLRHRVAIQQAVESKGATGQTVRVWSTVKTVWARIEPIRGEERIAAQQTQSKQTHRVSLRHNAYPALTGAHRFLFGTRIFEITSPPLNPGERNEEWLCDCREVSP